MSHECPYCGQECYCDIDDTGGMPVPSDCPHLNGECEMDWEPDDEVESDDEWMERTGEQIS